MTKSKLKAGDPKLAEIGKPKIVIYGKPGVGKTWTSLDFPTPYYIDTEGGANLDHYTDKLKAANGVYMGPEHGSLSFEEILGQVQALATEKHPYKTLVVDSISKPFNTEVAREAERLAQAGIKNEYGADRKTAVGYMRRLVSWLTRLDMVVILICHEKSEWGLDAKKQRVEIGTTFDCWDKLEYELHLCLQIYKAGPLNRRARVRKTRLTGFPEAETFEWSYKEFADRHGKDIIEKEVVQVVLATEEQLAELKMLSANVKLPENYLEKCLKAANVDSLEEMDSDKMTKIIDHIKTNHLPKGIN